MATIIPFNLVGKECEVAFYLLQDNPIGKKGVECQIERAAMLFDFGDVLCDFFDGGVLLFESVASVWRDLSGVVLYVALVDIAEVKLPKTKSQQFVYIALLGDTYDAF